MIRRTVALGLIAVTLTACGTISVEEEKRLGAQYQAQARKEFTFVRDPVTVNYIREFGASLVKGARPSPFEFRFFVIEDEEINAGAAPGGAMYVNTGLLLAASNGAELAGVLAHEMGHVTARHVAKSVNTQRGTGFIAQLMYMAVYILSGGNPILTNAGGMGISVAGTAFLSSFTRDDEREADDLAVETMVNSGWNPEGFVTMFETLKREYGSGGGPQFLSSHPATDERIENIQRDILKYPGSDKLRLDDPKLPIIQERLRLILGTDREKEDKSEDDEEDDSE